MLTLQCVTRHQASLKTPRYKKQRFYSVLDPHLGLACKLNDYWSSMAEERGWVGWLQRACSGRGFFLISALAASLSVWIRRLVPFIYLFNLFLPRSSTSLPLLFIIAIYKYLHTLCLHRYFLISIYLLDVHTWTYCAYDGMIALITSLPALGV